jgi:hypothetical protein
VACGRTSRVHAISFGMQICSQAGSSEDPDNKARQRTTSTRRKQERREAWRSVPCSALLGFLTVRVSSSVAIHGLEIADCE